MIDGEVFRRARRGERGERLLYAGTTRHEPSEAKTCQHSSTRRLVGNRQLSPDSPTPWETTSRSGRSKRQTCKQTRRERGETLDDPRMQRATAGDRIDCGMGPTRLTNQWRAKEWEGRVSPDSPPRPSYINDLAPHDILLPSSYLSPSASTHNKSPGHLHYNNSLSDTYL